MQSTGNGNRLTQNSTYVEGGHFRATTLQQTPTAIFWLLGVCYFMNVVIFVFILHSRTTISLEIMKHARQVEVTAGQVANTVAIEKLDMILRGNKSRYKPE